MLDRIWKNAGLDLRMTPYKVAVTGDGAGLIECVPESTTTATIQKEAGGISGAFKQTPLANWLRANNPKDDAMFAAVDNFALSCAGYCVATYILGIGDRHNDNVSHTDTSDKADHIDYD